MNELVVLSCPNCGQNLEVPGDIDHTCCSNCEYKYLVTRVEGVVTLIPQDPASSEQAAQKLEQEIVDLNKIIQETKINEGYKKNVFYDISLVIGVLFTLSSFWAWRQYKVTIWIVFFIAGIFIAIISGIAVRLQSLEYKEQTRKLNDMIDPYQIALERKQKELSCYKAVARTGSKPDDR